MTYQSEIFKALFKDRLNDMKAKGALKRMSLDYIPLEEKEIEEFSCRVLKRKDYLILTLLNNIKDKNKGRYIGRDRDKEKCSNLKLIKIARNNAYQNK